MKRFMRLHVGFEPPTPEVMDAWLSWFESIADRTVAQAGFAGGREISGDGTRDLPFGPGSLTGYNIIEAKDMAAAEAVARECPYSDAIRVYEVREHIG